MSAPTYQLQIITPQGVIYSHQVIHTQVPVENGYVGILANHADYTTSSAGGNLTVREREAHEEKVFITGPGLFEVNQNQARFFTSSCQSDFLLQRCRLIWPRI